MAASSSIVSCCLGPPAAPGARRPQAPAGVSVSPPPPHALRRACVAAAACAVIGMASGGGGSTDMALALARGGEVTASTADAVAVGAAHAKAPPAPPRWSDRRQCPAWRANSLENIVPENLPRPSKPRRFDSFSVSAEEGAAPAAPDLVELPSFMGQLSGTGCYSL